MAHDNQAHYAKIGFTIVFGICAIVATLIYLGGIRGRRDVVLVEVYYNKPVTGLSVGSTVNFRGMKVGEVREVSFVGSHYDVQGTDQALIYILMALNIRVFDSNGTVEEIERQIQRMVELRGLRASVNINGITGLSRIELDVNKGEEGRGLPKISWKPEHVYIPPKYSLIDNFSEAATKIMNQINTMDFNTFWSNLNVSVESAAHCAETVNNLIESHQANVAQILDNLTATSESLRELMNEVRQNPSVLIRGADRPTLEETAR